MSDLDARPRLAWAHLCEYAGFALDGRMVMVGVFEAATHITPVGPDSVVALPECSCLVVNITAIAASGLEHHVALVIRDEDGAELYRQEDGHALLKEMGPGRRLAGTFIMRMGSLELPGVGDYAFEIEVDGERIGDVPLYVQ